MRSGRMISIDGVEGWTGARERKGRTLEPTGTDCKVSSAHSACACVVDTDRPQSGCPR